jgi:hypothetical protein
MPTSQAKPFQGLPPAAQAPIAIWANHRPAVAITDHSRILPIGRLTEAIADKAKICAKRPRQPETNGERARSTAGPHSGTCLLGVIGLDRMRHKNAGAEQSKQYCCLKHGTNPHAQPALLTPYLDRGSLVSG